MFCKNRWVFKATDKNIDNNFFHTKIQIEIDLCFFKQVFKFCLQHILKHYLANRNQIT